MSDLNNLEYIPIGLASPEKILGWSFGEVTKPETINYKTFKPEKEGLFCERIFGPTKDWHCAVWCGNYKSKKPNPKIIGTICEKCGVEVTRSMVRRERMGHIELAAPVAHYWYMKTQPYYLSSILDVPYKKLESVIYCKTHLVTDPGDTPLHKMQLLSGSEYDNALYEYGNRFKAGIGASVVKQLLEEIDLTALANELQQQIRETKTQKRLKLIKRLKIVDAFRRSNNRPEWMVLTVLPVIPPDLRPMVQLDGGRFATSDLNDLYRRIINRNNRLKKLISVNAPDIIIENEIRMLQEAVDALIANHRRSNPVTGSGRRALKSLSQALEGKQGRFRQNLLGKRVDYSGRSVITVGPDLKIHQCGIPRKMALELFKPFVMNQMVEQGLAKNSNVAKRKIEQEKEEVWAVLEQVIDKHPVMLNRAPTLHKLSIRSFEPLLIEGEAITLHPLVCSGFNADFDGDQMAVHVPLSHEAQAEARVLMLASENLLHPQNGGSAVTHSQDMVLGCHYISLEVNEALGEGKVFKTEDEAINAYSMEKISLHAKIILYVKNHPKFETGKYLVTTVGKILFNKELPENLPYFNDSKILAPLPNGVFDNIKEAIDFIPNKPNSPIGKKFLQEIIGYAFDKVGKIETAQMLDGIKDIGFYYATKGGLTISLFDVETTDKKYEIIRQTEIEISKIEKLYAYGRISEEQRYEEIVELWDDTTDEVKKVTIENLKLNPMNPIWMMMDSGARGSEEQFRQLAGMRGLMADPSGRVIERPIKANFKEGLSVFEFFISSHGARKGMADTSLKTADSGYLTRRMVDVAQDVFISDEDCGTEEYFIMREIPDWAKLSERINGRFLAQDIIAEDGTIVARKEQLVDTELSKEIEKHTKEVAIRSLLTCDAKQGVCRKCYGVDLATREKVEVGEAVGVIAAQSIGEPGTQLTMRTFHSGGIAGDDITQGLPRIEEIFEARNINVKKGKAVLTEVSGQIEIVEKGRLKDVVVNLENGEAKVYAIPYGYALVVKEGQTVQVGDRLTQGNINPHELLRLKGMEHLQRYLIEEVQLVYRQQGVKIDDKHIEVIVRQMCRKVIVKEQGDSKLVPGRIVDKYKLKALNKKLKSEGKKEVGFNEQLLGITGASLSTESFLSSASFQETAKALTEAAIRGKKDQIKGLKEAVITGKLIPAGTGFRTYLEERMIDRQILSDDLED